MLQLLIDWTAYLVVAVLTVAGLVVCALVPDASVVARIVASVAWLGVLTVYMVVATGVVLIARRCIAVVAIPVWTAITYGYTRLLYSCWVAGSGWVYLLMLVPIVVGFLLLRNLIGEED